MEAPRRWLCRVSHGCRHAIPVQQPALRQVPCRDPGWNSRRHIEGPRRRARARTALAVGWTVSPLGGVARGERPWQSFLLKTSSFMLFYWWRPRDYDAATGSCCRILRHFLERTGLLRSLNSHLERSPTPLKHWALLPALSSLGCAAFGGPHRLDQRHQARRCAGADHAGTAASRTANCHGMAPVRSGRH